MAKGTAFTERELGIMSILWGEGAGTVAEVRDELVHSVRYTGVLKLLQILELKGMVRRRSRLSVLPRGRSRGRGWTRTRPDRRSHFPRLDGKGAGPSGVGTETRPRRGHTHEGDARRGGPRQWRRRRLGGYCDGVPRAPPCATI